MEMPNLEHSARAPCDELLSRFADKPGRVEGCSFGKVPLAGVLELFNVIRNPQVDSNPRHAGVTAVAEVTSRVTPCPGARAAATPSL
jgi:hypothetical protein